MLDVAVHDGKPIFNHANLRRSIRSSHRRLKSLSRSSSRPVTKPESRASLVNPVASFAQLCDAFRLVHDQYVAEGYMDPHISRMRYCLLQLLPISKQFVAVRKNRVVGTISLVLDSSAKLPSDLVFSSELNCLRREGRTIAEGTMFAVDSLRDPGSISPMLLRRMFLECLAIGIDDICVVVNPKHFLFYSRIMGFERLASVEDCSYVKGASGILLRLDLHAIREGRHKSCGIGKKILNTNSFAFSQLLAEYGLSQAEALVLLAQQPELLKNATENQLRILRQIYPLLGDIEEM